ncbi:hypothetical protein F0562_026709 [Nyssa sinensis]|uniref:Polymerase nucleotidyl transferase domain-containing protein n=1 Tax=Nyssa sinensis TaxID=561372 RepID=A0A5J5BE62_9ASTE|nr:hypothetical protein F0562_026709 [Nyssa sinensis]
MGSHEGWVQPNGFYPSGLLPNEATSMTRVFDQERWSIAEERTAELIACIQPNQPSEEHRNAVACYVERLITKCFPCQVFTYGSVPLKTYLPDGDIDLTLFSTNQNLKDIWADKVLYVLESEEKSEEAEFCVKEVRYIPAEVKIIKCLVENIVVDISFSQLGGLCTLCFLEEVDRFINQNHLFKRSIILIKAWCYYESRILGAHHRLISTYALETLVLYIFHVYNNSFAGPLEVLYHFLEFFSKFDWDNFCVSLWGPVPISSLPDMTADPPRKDGGELLLSREFLDACSSVYSPFPIGQETHELPFISNYVNVIDPLHTNNNLGRSVNKGNFFRIRSAFALGAQRLARLLDCRKENIKTEVNQYFMNTWDRHGKGCRPDAPSPDLYGLRHINLNHTDGSDGIRNYSSSKKVRENSTSHESEVELTLSPRDVFSQHDNQSLKRISRTNDVSSVSCTESQEAHANSTSLMASDQNHQMTQNTSSSDNVNSDNRISRPNNLENEIHVRYQLARTYSSPELTITSSEFSSQGSRNRASETTKGQTASTSLDYNRRKNLGADISENNCAISSTGDLPSSKDEPAAAEATQMHQEEQYFVNKMASSRVHNLGGHVHRPLNLASACLPVPVTPILASLGYAHDNSSGMVHTNVPSFESPWGSNIHYSQGLVSFPVYITSSGIASNQDEIVEPIDDSLLPKQTYMKDHGSMKENRGFVRENFGETPQNQNISGSDVYTTSSRFVLASQAASSETRQSSEGSMDGSSLKNSKSEQDRRVRKLAPSADHSILYKNWWKHEGKSVTDNISSQTHDSGGWIPLSVSTVDTEVAESEVPGTLSSSLLWANQIPGYEPAQMSGSNSMFPIAPMLMGSGSRQRAIDNNGVLPFAFYPMGPPVIMLPVYNFSTETGASNVSRSCFDRDGELDNSHSKQYNPRLGSTENLNQPEISSPKKGVAPAEPSEEHKSDILNSDLVSHWQNLQYGRLCQNPQTHGSTLYPSPVVVPPMYIQGHFPWNGPGIPLYTNANLFSHLMGYGPHPIPVPPLHRRSNRPSSVYQHYGHEIPRYRGGTGTYLPNPKISFRDRQSSNSRNKGNYSYNRKDRHSDREGKWNVNSKQRFAGRGQGRSQVEKPNRRIDWSMASNSQSDRPWYTFKPDSFLSNHCQNDPFSSSNSMHCASPNVAYGMYPLPVANPTGFSPGPVAMLYPYDQYMGCGPPELLEFGSLGSVHFSGLNEVLQLHDGSRGVSEQQNFQIDSTHSSPDQPSSPKLQR